MTTGGKRRDLDPRRGVYMISVAAELAGMHPQTLRIYESRGLIERMRKRMRSLERQAQKLEEEMAAELDKVRRSFKYELVPYEPPGQALVPLGKRSIRDGVRIPV